MTRESPQILLVGAGGIGGVIGSLLSASTANLTVVTRTRPSARR